PERKLNPRRQRTLAGSGLGPPPDVGRLNLQGPSLQCAGLERTPPASAVPGQPSVDATPSKTQRLDHDLRAFAGLDSFHSPKPNLFQCLVVKGTSIAALHASL